MGLPPLLFHARASGLVCHFQEKDIHKDLRSSSRNLYVCQRFLDNDYKGSIQQPFCLSELVSLPYSAGLSYAGDAGLEKGAGPDNWNNNAGTHGFFHPYVVYDRKILE